MQAEESRDKFRWVHLAQRGLIPLADPHTLVVAISVANVSQARLPSSVRGPKLVSRLRTRRRISILRRRTCTDEWSLVLVAVGFLLGWI